MFKHKIKKPSKTFIESSVYFAPGSVYFAPGSVYFAPGFGAFCTQNILSISLEYLHSFFSKQLLFEVHYAILSISSKIFLLIKKTNEGKGMILMENDCIPVNRKILYNDSLNCKEKIALIILLDTEAGSISYDHLAKKMDVTKPTAIATIKSLKDKGFFKCNLKQNRKQNGRTVTNQYFVTI